MPRQQYGLPYEQLPAATRRDLTPESALEQEIQTGRQAIQDKYTLQWKNANRGRRFVGAAKTSRILQEIDTRAKQEMQAFNQQAQQQTVQLQNIDRLAEQGAITNPEEIKARVTFGPDVAKSMYPTPERERTVPQQFGELDVYSHRISQELELFQIAGKKIPPKLTYGLYGPLMGGALVAYHGIKEKRKPELQIWDPSISAKVKGEDVMGDWRKAEPEEIARYAALVQEEKAITRRKTELLGQPDISRRRVQPDVKGGTFGDKIAESVRPQRQPTVTKPKVIRQRNTRTGKERISYDGGKTWQIVSG